MAIIVEDGTEVANANSYAAHTDLSDYADLRNITLSIDQDVREGYLIEAMDFIANFNWKGERLTTTQPLAWPRSGVVRDGQFLPHDEIPRELFYGQLALAIAAINNTLMPTLAANAKGPVIKEKVDVLEVGYANAARVLSVAADSTADALLKVLIRRSGLTVVRT